MTVTTSTLGFPRIGPRRELKFALERYWSGKSDKDELLQTAVGLRAASWALQNAHGANILPSNDFSLYDQVLDTSIMLGAIPERYKTDENQSGLDTYFAMARGTSETDTECCGPQSSLTACEMTKWFDTNYHYMVPELVSGQKLELNNEKIIAEYKEAKALGFETRPVLLGPVTWLSLAKGQDIDPFDYLDDVIAIYKNLLQNLAEEGVEWVQIDEPFLVLDLNTRQKKAFKQVYKDLSGIGPNIMLTTYFGGLEDNLDLTTELPVNGLHIDLVRAPDQIDEIIEKLPASHVLSLGVIDGRNIWRADLEGLLDILEPIAAKRDIILAPSCSLLHCPINLDLETKIDKEIKEWLAFAVQKIDELRILKQALNEGRQSVKADLLASSEAVKSRKLSNRIHDPRVAERLAAAHEDQRNRRSSHKERIAAQATRLNLPLFPSTTIGSFPQTKEVRHARAQHNKGKMQSEDYFEFLREKTKDAISWQEKVGLDMLVHGEFERNDMVQYFGEKLSGFVFTRHAWVQSYGSRCVRPPILYGDISRPEPMTVDWWQYAQSLTEKPVKGMLTGPVTILNWSFVRNDQPREESCRQIAFAIRDEVLDLEQVGCKAIQIDEAALREGLPLRQKDWQSYLDWAVDCFRLSAAGVRDETQIHTHMCYSEFNDILPSIGAMDTDVISIETARSQMELLEGFAQYQYPSAMGPGVYDIHAPRIPTSEEMVNLIDLAQTHLQAEQLWVNPDCGLKTRKWEEVKPAIEAMVAAAQTLRVKHSKGV